MLATSQVVQEVKIAFPCDEKQVYLCRHNMTELNENIAQLTDITIFQTCCNYLRYIPYGIGQLRNLKMLILSRNRLVELPDEIGLCKELKEIDVSFNLLKALPRSIAGLKKLCTLQIAGNYFEDIPSFIGKLTSLKYLGMGYNPFRNIPLEIFKLPFLLNFSCDNTGLTRNKKFVEVGEMSLMEIAARNLVKNNLDVCRHLSSSMQNHILGVQECSFCGGPLFDYYVEVEDLHVFESETYPVKYRMCCKHYSSHEDRLATLFERNMPTIPTKLIQDNMPSVTELFEPFCFNEAQQKRMEEGFSHNETKIPLISLAKYNSCYLKRYKMERVLEENIENYNVYDNK